MLKFLSADSRFSTTSAAITLGPGHFQYLLYAGAQKEDHGSILFLA